MLGVEDKVKWIFEMLRGQLFRPLYIIGVEENLFKLYLAHVMTVGRNIGFLVDTTEIHGHVHGQIPMLY